MSTPRIRKLGRFEDLPAEEIDRLRPSGATDEVFQTLAWQAAWWASFGRGTLLLLVAEVEGRPRAMAPMFADGGMAFLVVSGGSDYLDLLGDTSSPAVLEALLAAARDATPGFVGMRFYLVPDESPTGARLAAAAERLGLAWFDEGHLGAPFLDLTPEGAARAAAGRDSLVRHERWLRNHGSLEVEHARTPEAIRPHLDVFFEQHVSRWRNTPHPSLFREPAQRAFYRRFVEALAPSGTLRFTRVLFDGEPIAFHLGFRHGPRFLWYKPCFDPAWAKRSPGEVLLRSLFLAAAEEGASVFDFGLGEEPFRARFATGVRVVRTYGLYPKGAASP